MYIEAVKTHMNISTASSSINKDRNSEKKLSSKLEAPGNGSHRQRYPTKRHNMGKAYMGSAASNRRAPSV